MDNNSPMTEAVYYILIALRNPNHGYGIIQDISSLTNGRVVLGAGTLYGAIQSLLERGLIELVSAQTTSRKKKEYSITDAGVDALLKEWKRLEELLAHGKLID